MAPSPVSIGQPVRPQGSFTAGTVGCLATRASVRHLVTCAHVMGSPGWLYPEFEHQLRAPLARFEGLSLASDDTADLAAARILLEPDPHPGLLPAPLPGGAIHTLAGIRRPAPGMHLWLYGARTGRYLPVVVRAPGGSRWRKFELQFTVQLRTTTRPRTGDSGGPLVTASGHLVGFLMARDGDLAHAVPASCGLERLGLDLLYEEPPTTPAWEMRCAHS